MSHANIAEETEDAAVEVIEDIEEPPAAAE